MKKVILLAVGAPLLLLLAAACQNLPKKADSLAGEVVNATSQADQSSSLSDNVQAIQGIHMIQSGSFTAGTDEPMTFDFKVTKTRSGKVSGEVKIKHDVTVELEERTNRYNKKGTFHGKRKLIFTNYTNALGRKIIEGELTVKIADKAKQNSFKVEPDGPIESGSKVYRTTECIKKVSGENLLMEWKGQVNTCAVDLEIEVVKRKIQFEIGPLGGYRSPKLKKRHVKISGTVTINDVPHEVNREVEITGNVD